MKSEDQVHLAVPSGSHGPVLTPQGDCMSARLRDEADLCANEGADDIAQLLNEAAAEIDLLDSAARAYQWGYGYLQDRMESIGRQGWAFDCDGEITQRILSGASTVNARRAARQGAEPDEQGPSSSVEIQRGTV